jgi:NAD(P)-dependent dehydrogenase (short-subunit alcohol dehydrogenase family)
MEIRGKTVVLLGGSGLVGLAVARRIMAHGPARLVVSALTRGEAEQGVAALAAEGANGVEIVAEWGDMFVPGPLKDRSRADVLADADSRRLLLDDLYGDLSEALVGRSALGDLLLRHRPGLIIDCVNTATAFAYQNIFQSAARLRSAAEAGGASAEQVERHLATLYLPQLIRHVQITLEAMRRCETELYLKIGTAGTGGMGLNIPFTHSEERPSRMLLAKSSLAGAHTLLLYLLARTPGAPAVKEIKPTAAISWKRIGYGEIRRAGRPIARVDAERPLPLAEAFASEEAAAAATRVTGSLEGVFIDAGENGLFSLGEFETLTALGLMEYITPEEIADDVLREVRGYPTGKDVVAALDASTSGPTYRAGVLREVAIARMEELERERGVNAVAYEMLGPPRLSKLLFEGAILARFCADLDQLAALDPDDAARRASALIAEDADLRSRILSIGLPILMADGASVLRGTDVKVRPEAGQDPADPRLADNGWVDLRPANWDRWRRRGDAMRAELASSPGADFGSRSDAEPGHRGPGLRPGSLASWIFRNEDRGRRIKR